MKNEKVSNVNIFKNTFSKSKPRSLVPQYSRIILNKGQNPTTIKQLTCQTLNLFHSFKVCKKWSQKLPFSRLSNKAEYSMTSLYLFSPSSSGNHKEKGTKGRIVIHWRAGERLSSLAHFMRWVLHCHLHDRNYLPEPLLVWNMFRMQKLSLFLMRVNIFSPSLQQSWWRFCLFIILHICLFILPVKNPFSRQIVWREKAKRLHSWRLYLAINEDKQPARVWSCRVQGSRWV